MLTTRRARPWPPSSRACRTLRRTSRTQEREGHGPHPASPHRARGGRGSSLPGALAISPVVAERSLGTSAAMRCSLRAGREIMPPALDHWDAEADVHFIWPNRPGYQILSRRPGVGFDSGLTCRDYPRGFTLSCGALVDMIYVSFQNPHRSRRCPTNRSSACVRS
jgi:hypothetical protein